jgi:hypothetical protein
MAKNLTKEEQSLQQNVEDLRDRMRMLRKLYIYIIYYILINYYYN